MTVMDTLSNPHGPRDALRQAALQLTEMIYGPGWDKNRPVRIQEILRNLDPDEIHEVHTTAAWGESMRPLTKELGHAWSGIALRGYSFVGLALLRGDGPILDAAADFHPLDLTRSALVFESTTGNGIVTALSPAAKIIASGARTPRLWWEQHLQRYPSSRPRDGWDATHDMQVGRRMGYAINPLGEEAPSLLSVLRWAPRVDVRSLASGVVERPNRNRLIDALDELHTKSKLLVGHDLLHLVLRPDVDSLPGRRQPGLLHLYAGYGDVQACLKLLEHGYPTGLKDGAGRTALQLAEQRTGSPGLPKVRELLRSWQTRQGVQAALDEIARLPAGFDAGHR